MAVFKLGLIEDRSLLAGLAKGAIALGPPELRRRWEWIMRWRNARQVCEAIASAWSASPFAPLRDWSEHLATASVLLREESEVSPDDLAPTLLLELDAAHGCALVELSPPMLPTEAEAALQGLSCGTRLIADLLCAAPGLSLGVEAERRSGNGVLCPPEFFLHRMATINWSIQQFVDSFRERGATFDAPETSPCAAEVLRTVLGDSYVLTHEDRLMFFDHEEMAFQPVKVDFPRLVEAFLADSERVIEPSNLQ